MMKKKDKKVKNPKELKTAYYMIRLNRKKEHKNFIV